jgi:hypothetical protein
MKFREISWDGHLVLGNKESIDIFSDETSCKTEREMTKNRSSVYLSEIGLEHPTWVDLAEDHVQWWALD